MYINMAGKDRHLIDAVATVKKMQDRFYRLHIYEVNDCKMNNWPSYVFKSSTLMAKIALLMDQDHEEKMPFQDVVAFMNGLHSHVKDYTTLNLWLHNPVICHMQCIAYMDCESENTTNITTFLTLVNKILRKVKGDPDYVWNPRAIMTDDNAANKITVEDMLKRTVSCQWHYLRCAKKQSNRVTEKTDKFQEYSRAFVEQAVNLNEYVHTYQSKLSLCKKYGCMKWLEFWHYRQAPFVLAFHGFGYPDLNLAKAGQSTMRPKQLTLVDTAFDDVIQQMQQDKIYQLTLQNEVKGLGEGEEAQKQCALQYVKTLREFVKNKGKIWNDMLNIPSAHDPSAFHPDEDAKHKYISDSDDDQKGNKGRREKRKQRCSLRR